MGGLIGDENEDEREGDRDDDENDDDVDDARNLGQGGPSIRTCRVRHPPLTPRCRHDHHRPPPAPA